MKKSLLAVAMLLAFAVSPAFGLELGDKAPEISAQTWVTGEPADPTRSDGETVYLVEVWSTTCPPCVTSIPILNGLQAKYADQGLKIVSFTPDSEEDVRPFLDNVPMEYSSFIDKEGASFINYMAADNRNTIPHAFLFDKSGTLVWIGNPLDNLESRIQGVLDGTLNAEHALAVRDAREGLQAAFETQDVETMMKSLAALESLEPANGQYYQIHYRLLTELGVGEDADIRALLDDWYKGCRDSAEDLMILGMVALDQGHPARRNPELGLNAARRAYSLESDIKAEAGINLAECYKSIGRLDQSLAVLKDLSNHIEPSQIELVAALENYYNRLVDMGKSADIDFKP